MFSEFSAPHLSGSVLNASGWRDEDKEGNRYAGYFPHATRYVVFCHTVLEHVAGPFLALDNLAALARKALILVVPFVQVEHYEVGSYLDYVRFTPLGLAHHVERRGFRVARITTNRNPVYPTYVFCLALRPEHAGLFPRELEARAEMEALPGIYKPLGGKEFLC